jgi:hypothetical protein
VLKLQLFRSTTLCRSNWDGLEGRISCAIWNPTRTLKIAKTVSEFTEELRPYIRVRTWQNWGF